MAGLISLGVICLLVLLLMGIFRRQLMFSGSVPA
jgi:hypothetical protein